MSDNTGTAELTWLEGCPSAATGVSFGVPWRRGALDRNAPLRLRSGDGGEVPLQTWATAFWPDGTVKWTGHATTLSGPLPESLALEFGERRAGEVSVRVIEEHDSVKVDTGLVSCRFNRVGSNLIGEVTRGGVTSCTGARLVSIQERRSNAAGLPTVAHEELVSEIGELTVEQRGPVRAVVRIDGRHASTIGTRAWLPFRVRFYLYAGQDSVRMVHSFVYDGNPNQDFVRGLGVAFTFPVSGALYNRHVRFAGDTGYFTESPKTLLNRENLRFVRNANADAPSEATARSVEMYERQIRGERVVLDPEDDSETLRLVDDAPTWDSFKLFQDSSDSYSILKRTRPGCSWVKAAQGGRARGLAYFGGESGGPAIGMKAFWEKHPRALEVHGLSGTEAEAVCWFWSPDAQAMDLRHYDTETHVDSSYEGAAELRATPYGVANTNELSLWWCDDTPPVDAADAMTEHMRYAPQLVCAPDRYHETGVFGVWSLPDRATPAKAWLEDQLDALFAYYRDEINIRRWYGFWNWGDIMHTYDAVRHTWCYDIGGYAWQNTELVPNMWLWYAFLRSGRTDIFRMAEAMTRHTSEVDLYHIGEYRGLGSRHNVVHWGCGAKEARIGMAGLHRFYHYLTTDERVGDIMSEVKDSDYTTVQIDPMRAYFPKDGFPTHVRSGPDWAAFCSNWMTQWERFEDTTYRDKLLVGLKCLADMPLRLLSGPTFGYDPKYGTLTHMGDENYGYPMIVGFGAPQVWLELLDLLDSRWADRFADMLAEFGEIYPLPLPEKRSRTNGALGIEVEEGAYRPWGTVLFAASLMAFAAVRLNRPELAQQVWDLLLVQRELPIPPLPAERREVATEEYVRPITEIPWMTTNGTSQWCLNVIVALELVGEYLPPP